MAATFYALVHIPKTAGTTLIHLLRRNFFLRCMDVRPFSSTSGGVFGTADLQKSLRLNPALKCITGHSVRAYANLETVVPDISYFTILRDPVKRHISAFLYLTDVMQQDLTLRQHLDAESKHNIQTRWIAGEADLGKAKELLDSRFCVVGRTERLNEFILLLAREMARRNFDPHYQSKNIAETRGEDRKARALELAEQYGDEIRERNSLDTTLIAYVDDVIIPRQKAAYGPAFASDLARYESELATPKSGLTDVLPYIDYAVRKLYYDPVTGVIRLKNGLPYHGSF